MARFKLADRLRELGYSSYAAYLKGPEWTEFKKRYQASNRIQTCKACSNPKVSLHHVTYYRVGKEELDDVVPLCERHHDQVHRWLKSNKKSLKDTDRAIDVVTRKQVTGRNLERQYKGLTKFEKLRLPVEVRRQLVGFCHLCGSAAKNNNKTCKRCVVAEMAKKGYVPDLGSAAGYVKREGSSSSPR